MSFTVDVKPLQRLAQNIKKLEHDLGREVARAGCIAAGLQFRSAVRGAAPRLKPENVWKYTGKKGRNRWQHEAGELAGAIYFTNSPRNTNIPGGKIGYLVGIPHSRGKDGGWTAGWYAHMLIGGHYVENYWFRERKSNQKIPLLKGNTPQDARFKYLYGGSAPSKINVTKRNGRRVREFRHEWVPARPFVDWGFRRSQNAAKFVAERAADKKAKQLLGKYL